MTADFHGTAPWQLWIAYFTGVIVAWAASDLAIKLFFGRDNRAGRCCRRLGRIFQSRFSWHAAHAWVFSARKALQSCRLIVAIHMPIMMAASITLHEIAMRRDGVFEGEGHFGLGCAVVLQKPAAQSLRAWHPRRLDCGVSPGLRMPVIADSLIQTLGSVAGPVALFAMGMGLRRNSAFPDI